MRHNVLIEYYQKIETQSRGSWTELRATARNFVALIARIKFTCAQVKFTCVGNPTNSEQKT